MQEYICLPSVTYLASLLDSVPAGISGGCVDKEPTTIAGPKPAASQPASSTISAIGHVMRESGHLSLALAQGIPEGRLVVAVVRPHWRLELLWQRQQRRQRMRSSLGSLDQPVLKAHRLNGLNELLLQLIRECVGWMSEMLWSGTYW